MQHEFVVIPVPPRGRVTSVIWFLPSDVFDAFCRDEQVTSSSARTDDGTSFRFTSTYRAGVRVSVIEALGDSQRVTADVEVKTA